MGKNASFNAGKHRIGAYIIPFHKNTQVGLRQTDDLIDSLIKLSGYFSPKEMSFFSNSSTSSCGARCQI